MKTIAQWSREAQLLSALEMEALREALDTLLTWEPFQKEYAELDFLKTVLGTELFFGNHDPSGQQDGKELTGLHHLSKHYTLHLPAPRTASKKEP